MVDAPAFLAFVGAAGVEHDAVAGFERRGELQGDGFVLHAGDFAEEHAALGAEAAMGEFLIVDAAKPAGVEATRETHLEFVARGLRFEFRRRFAGKIRHDFVERLSVNARDAGDVLRRFEPAYRRGPVGTGCT